MPTWPRATRAWPRFATPFSFPQAMQSWSPSGHGQIRSIENAGRVWQEVYPFLNTDLPSVRALLAAINQGIREGVAWDIQHPYFLENKGNGTGNPTVSGGGQTGSTLSVSGAGSGVWLAAGDLIKIAGLNLVFEATADVTGSSIPINPPIFVGQSPSGGADVEHIASNIFFHAVLVDVAPFPMIGSTKYLEPGMTLTFREQP